MHFDSFSSFIEMGGHWPYVWSCYGVFVLIIAGNFISPVLARKKILKDIERQMRREQK